MKLSYLPRKIRNQWLFIYEIKRYFEIGKDIERSPHDLRIEIKWNQWIEIFMKHKMIEYKMPKAWQIKKIQQQKDKCKK
jgi:hypothetical protein